MYYKHSLFLLSAISCTVLASAQERKTTDQIFYEVSGPVKTMTEREAVQFPESANQDTSRTVFYFDQKGQLSRTEYYNQFNRDKPGPPILGNISRFQKQEGHKRFYYKIQTDRKDPVEFFSLQRINASTLKYSFSTIMSKDTLVKIFTLNKDNRFTSCVSSGRVYRFPANKRLDYFYNEQGIPVTIRITDTETKESLDASLQDDTYDQYGNIITGVYVGPDSKIVYRILRSYTYYSK